MTEDTTQETLRVAAIADESRQKTLSDWQNKTLPLVRWGVVILALTVFGATISASTFILPKIINGSDHVGTFSDNLFPVSEQQTPVEFDMSRAQMALLAYRTGRRHDRANAALLTRELLRFGGFLIGSALTFVGALFTIGKFSDIQPTTLKVKGYKLESSLVTASPGLFAMAIGGGIILVAILAHYEIEVNDEAFTITTPIPGYTSTTFTQPKKDELTCEQLCEMDEQGVECQRCKNL